MVADPQLLDGSYASGYRYDNTSKVVLSDISGVFTIGEKITFDGGYGYIAYIETDSLYLTGLNGFPSGVITGETSTATGTVSSVTNGAFKISGSVIFKSYFNPRTKLLNDNVEIKPLFSF